MRGGSSFMRINSSLIRIRTLPQFVFLFLLITFGAGSRDYVHAADAKPISKATFAGGCFWCMQPAFDGLPGVISTTVGYTGGDRKSTRLNSSHGYNSYAVFCLKKKKNAKCWATYRYKKTISY